MATTEQTVGEGEGTGGWMQGEGGLEASELLANALKKMDGLIGDYRDPSPPPDDPLTLEIVETCEKLKSLINEQEGKEGGRNDSREAIAQDTKDLLVSWLTGKDVQVTMDTEQLQHDKQELLRQVVGLEEQVEAGRQESDGLRARVDALEAERGEKETHCQALLEELKAAKATLDARQVELKQLQEEVQAGYRGTKGHSARPGGRNRPVKHVTLKEPLMHRSEVKRSSFRQSLKKAFGRKKEHTATLQPAGSEGGAQSAEQLNLRAATFHAMNRHQVGEWMASIGLDMYQELVEQEVTSGTRLVEIVTADSSQELIRIGVLSTLHCKKLRLAVQEAVNDEPSPLAQIDHTWVADWLKMVGLNCYRRSFLDARIDGRMLNYISMEDLQLLDIVTPFHIVSLKRAIQAFRMCGYNPDYLKEPSEDKGSQKLLHWSADRVVQWVRSIELDEYVEGLEILGIHGAVMLLDVQFTSDSLARAMGISPSQSLIRKHLSRKFMELIGPTAAQRKVDAMQSKGFAALDPTEQPRGSGRVRSRSLGSRRGRGRGSGMETLLCPLEDFPVAVGPHLQLVTTPPPGTGSDRPSTP